MPKTNQNPYADIHFHGQQSQEKVLFQGFKHGLVLLGKIIKHFFIISFIGSGLYAFLYFGDYSTNAVFIIIGLIMIIDWAMIIFIYKNTYILITNQRFIITIQRGLFSAKTRSTNLEKISETAFSLSGLIGSVFGFGKLIIQSDVQSPENRQMLFENLKNVKDVKFFLDKVSHLSTHPAEGKELPIFITGKKGKRY